MKSYRELAWKTCLSAICVASVGTVAIHDRLDTVPEDKIYPIALFLAIIYLHWIAWELFFALFGVPEPARDRIRSDGISMRSASGLMIGVGHVFTLISIFNHVFSPEYAYASETITWTTKLIAAGVLIQMLFSIRELLSDRFRNEKGA